jgi:hypothetical protein
MRVYMAGAALGAVLIAGCGGGGSTARRASPTTKAQAVAYARAVNLHAGDLSGFSSSDEGEAEAPQPRQAGRDALRCIGGLGPAQRTTAIFSTTLSAGPVRSSRFVRSIVEVGPTHAELISNSAKSHSPRGRACFTRFLEALRTRINLERHGRGQYGPFRVSTVPISIPGVERGFLTSINETRLRRSGAILIHIYRDLFSFISGPAEVELEATGFSRPVAASTETQALGLLIARARANAKVDTAKL